MTSSLVLFQVNAVFGFEKFNFFFLEIFVHLPICLYTRRRAGKKRAGSGIHFLSCQVTCIDSANHMIERAPTQGAKFTMTSLSMLLRTVTVTITWDYVIVILDIRNSS